MNPDGDSDWPFRLDPRDVDYRPLALAERNALSVGTLVDTGFWDADSACATIEALAVRDLIEMFDPYECAYCLTDFGGPYCIELEAIARAEHDALGNPGPEWQCTASTEKGKVREIIRHYGAVSPLLYAVHISQMPIPRAGDEPHAFTAYWKGPRHRAERRLHALTLDGTMDHAKEEAAIDDDAEGDDVDDDADDGFDDDVDDSEEDSDALI